MSWNEPAPEALSPADARSVLSDLARDPSQRGALRRLAADLLGAPERGWEAALANAVERKRLLLVPEPELARFVPDPGPDTREAFSPDDEGDSEPAPREEPRKHYVEVQLVDAFGRDFETDVVVITADGVQHDGRTVGGRFSCDSTVPGEAKIRLPNLRKEDWPEPPAAQDVP